MCDCRGVQVSPGPTMRHCGGKDNYEVDREVLRQLRAVAPGDAN